MAGCHRAGWPSRHAPAATCPCWNDNGSPPCANEGSASAIARRLGRSPSTISRELRRHLRPHDRGIYDGDLAHAHARERSRRPRRPLLSREPELRQIVQDKLKEEWSPAQIAAHLRETYPDRPEWHLCHETIYQALTTAEKAA